MSREFQAPRGTLDWYGPRAALRRSVLDRARQVFESAGCVACHTLEDAGSTGTVGPNLDDAKPPATLVVTRVTEGAGAMPSFKDKLTEQQIQDVAAYVSSAAGTS